MGHFNAGVSMIQEEPQGQLSSPRGVPGGFIRRWVYAEHVAVSQVKGRLGASPPVTNPKIVKVQPAQQAGLPRKQALMATERPLALHQLSRFFQCFFPNPTFLSTATCEPLLLFRGPAAAGSKTVSNSVSVIIVLGSIHQKTEVWD